MEYLGNIIAVTVDELTRATDGPAIISYDNYRQLCCRGRITVLRQGKGLDHHALIEYASLPTRFKEKFVAKYGDPEEMLNRNMDDLKMDMEARQFFEDYELADGTHIKSDKIDEYVINASALNRLIELSNLQRSRRNMSGNRTPLNWDAIYSTCEDLRAMYAHTLPKNAARLREKMRTYAAEGYGCLVSGKLTNGNAVKITPEAGRQIIALKRSKTPVYT
ncbi:MAG: kinase, partial [Bacteroidales bacterium]|nr:kinase [Bacteroidales bacterium]